MKTEKLAKCLRVALMRGSLVLVALFQSAVAFAGTNDPPSFGMVMNEAEKDFIQFLCLPPNPQGMTCDFVQVHVYANGGPDALAKSLADIAREEKEFSSDQGKLCADMKNLAQVMRAGPPYRRPASQTFLDKWATSSGQERADMLKDVETFEKHVSHRRKRTSKRIFDGRMPRNPERAPYGRIRSNKRLPSEALIFGLATVSPADFAASSVSPPWKERAASGITECAMLYRTRTLLETTSFPTAKTSMTSANISTRR